MVSTKDSPGAFDGMVRAEPDEPVFTLRAHDLLASGLVAEWAARKRKLILTDTKMSEEKRRIELIQCREADEIAFAMSDWRAGVTDEHAAVVPDKPAPTYSGNVTDPAEIEAKARHDAVKGAATRLHNSVAEITDAVALLVPYGWDPERAAALNAAGQIRVVATAVEPKRIGYAVTDQDRERAAAKAGK